MWIRDAKGLWPYSVHMYGIIFDQSTSVEIFQIIKEHDLEAYDKAKCLINGNYIRNDLKVPPKRIKEVI